MSTFRLNSDKSEITLAIDDLLLIEDKSNSYTVGWTSPLAIKTWLENYFYLESEVDALTWTESDITDLDKYTQAEVDTISGSLSTEIDSDITTHSASADHDGRYYTESEVDALTWTESDIVDLDKYTQAEVDTISGSLQTNIDNKSDTGHSHTESDISDLDKYTQAEVDTISGSLSTEIDSDISTHSSSADHDGRYYTQTEIDTWRNSTTQSEMAHVHGVTSDIQTQIDTKAATSLIAAPASDHTAEGPQTNDIAAGEAVTVMECCYLNSIGEWSLTDANAVATAEGMLAISLATTASGNAMNVALPNTFIRDDTWNWTISGEIYLSGTAGALTQTAPSATDDIIRIVGHATHADRMFFNPAQTIVIHT